MTEYIRVLLENGHYLMVVTNGTVSKRFDEIAVLPPDLLKRLFFRNRTCADGSEWLKPEFKAFISQKLKDANREFTPWEKRMHALRYHPLVRKLFGKLRHTS